MKNNFLIILIISIINSFNAFNQDDWFIISEPDNVKSITEDSFYIYFLADNGIYAYDIITEDFLYNIELSSNLINEKKYFIHYHKGIDYFFVLTKNYLLYKSSVSSLWNEISFSSLSISSIDSINRVGFTNDEVIIQTLDSYIIVDIFSLTSSKKKNINDLSNILWINNGIENLDLSDFYTIDNSIISDNYIIDEVDIKHYVISSFYDQYDNLWLGMDTGAIFKVDDFSYNIKRLNIGPRTDNISNIFIDNKSNWYFADNYFRRSGEVSYNYNGYLLSIWDENDNSWSHIPKKENIIINNININDIKQIDNFIIIATLEGIIVYDVKYNSWYHNYKFLNINNRAIWNIFFNNDKIYFSTSNGMVICDYKTINGELKFFKDEIILENSEIYDIKSYNKDIIFSSIDGLFTYSEDSGELILIDKHIYYNIEFFDDYILGSRNNLWIIHEDGRELISNNVNYFNITSENGKVCSTDLNQIKLIDLYTKDEKDIPLNLFNVNGPIYNVDCDNEWLWFSNSNSVYFFKWTNYEN